jgi:Holliday junction resolvase RusA-like endonuclease
VSEGQPVIELTLPYPPSVNATHRAVNGRVILSKRYRDWILEAGKAVAAQLPAQAPLKHYRLWIEATPPDLRRRDLGNLEKPTSDLLKRAGVIEDDHMAQGIFLVWSKTLSAKPGSLKLRIYAL